MISKYEIISNSVACISRDIQRLERAEMAKYNLKAPHAQCLLVLSRYPEGLIATQLCELCEKDKAAISRTLSELERQGLVQKRKDGENAYRAPVLLTEAGREASARVEQLAQMAVEQAGVGLTEERRAVFYETLELIAGNLTRISRDGLED